MATEKKVVDGVTHHYIKRTFEFTPMTKKPENPNRKHKMVEGRKVMVEEKLNGINVRYLQHHEKLCE